MKVNKVMVGAGAVAGVLTVLACVKELRGRKEECTKSEDELELADIFTNVDDMLVELPVSLLSAICTSKDELYNNVGRMHYEYYDPIREAAHFSEIAFGTECVVYPNICDGVNYRFGGGDV
jgi:hypothetical protein